MTLREPSVLFDVITSLHDDVLVPIVWPSLLAAGGENLNPAGVQVLFGDQLEDLPRESVCVTGLVDDGSASWEGMGLPHQEEQLSTLVVAQTWVPNRTAREAWARLRVITNTIAGGLRDLNTGNPIIPTATALLGVYSWGITGRQTDLAPVKEVGHVASCGLTITIKAQI